MPQEGNSGVKKIKMFKKVKPYAAMVLLQCSLAVMYIILLATLEKGMNQFIMFSYRGVVAASVVAPFALIFERKGRPKLTLVIFIKIIALGILQPVLDQNFYLMGANMTSAGFASALENINPAVTFVICLLLRSEKLNIQKRHGLAKVIGALLVVFGAILMILYKGPFVEFFWSKGREKHNNLANSNEEATRNLRWIKGIFMILLSCFSWSSFLILQANTLNAYPAKLSLTGLVCSVGAITNAVIALVVEQGSLRPWILGFDMRLFAVIYSGVIGNAFSYFVLGMVSKEKGPFFSSAFNPVLMIMTNVLSSIFLAEKTALGTILGGSILVVGMYSMLWGKSKDYSTNKLENEKDSMGPQLPITTSNIHNNINEESILKFEHIVIEKQKKIEEIPVK